MVKGFFYVSVSVLLNLYTIRRKHKLIFLLFQCLKANKNVCTIIFVRLEILDSWNKKEKEVPWRQSTQIKYLFDLIPVCNVQCVLTKHFFRDNSQAESYQKPFGKDNRLWCKAFFTLITDSQLVLVLILLRYECKALTTKKTVWNLNKLSLILLHIFEMYHTSDIKMRLNSIETPCSFEFPTLLFFKDGLYSDNICQIWI